MYAYEVWEHSAQNLHNGECMRMCIASDNSTVVGCCRGTDRPYSVHGIPWITTCCPCFGPLLHQ